MKRSEGEIHGRKKKKDEVKEYFLKMLISQLMEQISHSHVTSLIF